MTQLRKYQNDCTALIQEMFAKGFKRVVLCLPTGGGKTVVFSEIAWKAFMKGKKVLILTHRKELVKQASKFNNNGCKIGMVETIFNQIESGAVNINNFDLFIIDEAHIGNFKKVLAHYTGYVIGATATPITKPSMCNLFNEIVCPVDIPELIDLGFLSKPRTFLKKAVDADFSTLKVKGDDFSKETLDQLFNKPKTYLGVVEDYVKKGEGMKTIVFCVNIDHAEHTFNEFQRHGIKTWLVHSKQKTSIRDENIDAFTHSLNGVLVNASIATTGFDVPDIRLVIINRATMSVALWLQMCGRGSRVTPTKNTFQIWDYGENVPRLGHWEQDRDWRKIFFAKDVKKAQSKAPAIKECPKCEAVVSASARVCEFCQYEFDKKTIPPTEGELVEIAYKTLKGRQLYDLNYDELFDLARLKKYKQFFVEMVLYHNQKLEGGLERFWDTKQYKDGYRERKIQKLCQTEPPANFFIKQPTLN